KYCVGNSIGQGLLVRWPAIPEPGRAVATAKSRGRGQSWRGVGPLGKTTGQRPASGMENPRGHRRENALSDLNKINSGHMAWPFQNPNVENRNPKKDRSSKSEYEWMSGFNSDFELRILDLFRPS